MGDNVSKLEEVPCTLKTRVETAISDKISSIIVKAEDLKELGSGDYTKDITVVVTPRDANYLEVAAALNNECEVVEPDADSAHTTCHHTENNHAQIGNHTAFLTWM